jgi:hypothetical protein
MPKFIVSKQSCTGERLGAIEAPNYGAASAEAARTLLCPKGIDLDQIGAHRVTGEPGKSGCFRVCTPGPNRMFGERTLGQQFHVREV